MKFKYKKFEIKKDDLKIILILKYKKTKNILIFEIREVLSNDSGFLYTSEIDLDYKMYIDEYQNKKNENLERIEAYIMGLKKINDFLYNFNYK